MKIHQGKLKKKKYGFGRGGSSPEESYDVELLSDPSYKQKSVYVPDDIKVSIDKWAKDMGLKEQVLKAFIKEFLKNQDGE